VTFGLGEPTRGDYGLSRDNGIAWLVEAIDRDAPDETTTTRRRKRDGAQPRIAHKRLMPADALRIRGCTTRRTRWPRSRSRARSTCRRAAAACAARIPRRAHRVEVIATIDDVDYVDDSKGTNVGATVAALDGLAQKIVLIAGGDGKGQDFAPLVAPVARWCRAVVLIGRDAPALRATLADTGVPLADRDARGAVRAAAELAEPGDAVLLSPACASLDMFRNYAHRAEVFRAAVENSPSTRSDAMSWSDRLVSAQRSARTGGNAAGARRLGHARATGGLASVVNGVRPSRSRMLDFDHPLLWVAIALLGLGVVMVYSASIAMPDSPKYARIAITHS
jgi:hypothetical protein